jgi:hypothetical protein
MFCVTKLPNGARPGSNLGLVGLAHHPSSSDRQRLRRSGAPSNNATEVIHAAPGIAMNAIRLYPPPLTDRLPIPLHIQKQKGPHLCEPFYFILASPRGADLIHLQAVEKLSPEPDEIAPAPSADSLLAALRACSSPIFGYRPSARRRGWPSMRPWNIQTAPRLLTRNRSGPNVSLCRRYRIAGALVW